MVKLSGPFCLLKIKIQFSFFYMLFDTIIENIVFISVIFCLYLVCQWNCIVA